MSNAFCKSATPALATLVRTSPLAGSVTLNGSFEPSTNLSPINRPVDDLAMLMSLENGKTLVDAKAEVNYAAEFFRWFSEEAVRIDGSIRNAPSGANRILTYKQPIGIAFLITPWNFPAAM